MFRQRNWASPSTIVSLIAMASIMAITIAGAGTVWAATSPDGLSASNEIQAPAPDDRLATQVPSTADAIAHPSMTVTGEDVVPARTNNRAPTKMNRQMTPEITIEASRNPYVAGLGDLTFTLTRTGDTTSELDVTVGLVQDQAWLSATSSSVTFAAGASTSTLTLSSTAFSTDVTQSGTLTATVDAVSGYDTSGASVSVSVISLEGPAVTVSFEETEYSVAENAGSLDVVLVARATTSVPYVPEFRVSVLTRPISASSILDYVFYSEHITFAPTNFEDDDGALVASVAVALTILNDEIREEDEQFGLELEIAPDLSQAVGLLDPSGALCDLICDDLYPVTILNDDPNVSVSFEQDSYEIAEGASSTITLVLSEDPQRDVTIPITLTGLGGASSTDYTPVNGSVEFQPGATSRTFTFEAVQDSDIDDGESVLLEFGDLPIGVTAGMHTTTTVSITDDDPNVSVSFEQDSYEVAEGASSTITVVLSEDPQRDVTIPIKSCEEGGATCTDYTIVNDSVEFQPGATSSTFTFEAVQDSDNDDGESVLLEFGDLPVGVTAGMHPETTVTIIDDDDPIVSVSFEKDSYDVAEGGSVSVKVTLSADPERDVTIPIMLTEQGGASSTDYTPVNGSVEFQPGATSSTFTFEAVQDSDIDDGESVLLEFGDLPVSVTPGMHTTTTISITDDDPNVSVSFEQDVYEVAEGSSITVKITLSADPERDVNIPIMVTEQGGTSVADYAVVSEVEVVEFSPGDTEKTLTINASQDFWNDDGESLLLKFGDLPVGVTAGMHPTATVSIIDDDEGDPALNVGTPAAYWTVNAGSEELHPETADLNDNLLILDSCVGRRSFKILWAGPGDGRQADRWEAYSARHGAVGDVSHQFRTDQTNTRYTALYGTIWLDGEGSVSFRIRGWFGTDGLGEWSPAVGLFCQEEGE